MGDRHGFWGDRTTSATCCNVVGEVFSNAFSGVIRPERAFVFVARERIR